MNTEDTDFITNIANSLARDIIDKMVRAKEYFREDSECVAKCVMMQHIAICNILMDYIQVMDGVSELTPKQLFAIVQEDTFNLIKKHKELDERTTQ